LVAVVEHPAKNQSRSHRKTRQYLRFSATRKTEISDDIDLT
jgi:hypothetical protein